MSDMELLKCERGRRWRVTQPFVVTSRGGHQLTVRKGYVHDRYTFAPDTLDEKPAAVHDFTYDGCDRKWDDGTLITREDADLLLYDLMVISPDLPTRQRALQYYQWVRRVGGVWWAFGTLKTWLRSNVRGG